MNSNDKYNLDGLVLSLFTDVSSLKIVDDYIVDDIRIVISADADGLRYNALEPQLSDLELITYRAIYSHMIRHEFINTDKITTEELDALFVDCARQLKKDKLLENNKKTFLYYLHRNVFGYQVLDILINDDDVADFGKANDDTSVTLLHRKHAPNSNMSTNIKFVDIKHHKQTVWSAEDQVDSLLSHLAQKMGSHHLTEFEPYLEGTLPSGARATLWHRGKTNPDGSMFSIRKPMTVPITITQMLHDGILPYELAALIWSILDTSGGTGLIFGAPNSGKTTTTNALTNFVDPNKKIFTVEDTAELSLLQDNVTPLLTKKSDAEHSVTYMTLFERIMRLTPGFVCVGEVRLRDIEGLLHLFESGCPAIGTFHAPSESAAVSRLRKLGVIDAELLNIGFLLGMGMNPRRNYARRLTSFSETYVTDDGDVGFDRIVTYDRINDTFEGADLESLAKSRKAMECGQLRGVSDVYEDLSERVKFLKMSVGQKKFSPLEVKESFKKYYNDYMLQDYDLS